MTVQIALRYEDSRDIASIAHKYDAKIVAFNYPKEILVVTEKMVKEGLRPQDIDPQLLAAFARKTKTIVNETFRFPDKANEDLFIDEFKRTYPEYEYRRIDKRTFSGD